MAAHRAAPDMVGTVGTVGTVLVFGVGEFFVRAGDGCEVCILQV